MSTYQYGRVTVAGAKYIRNRTIELLLDRSEDKLEPSGNVMEIVLSVEEAKKLVQHLNAEIDIAAKYER